MRPELETYHLIDSYLNGKLEGEALRAFENQLQSDPAFAEEVSFQQLTNEVVIGSSYDSLRSQMTKDIDKIDASAKTKTWSLYTVATFILLTGAVSTYYYTHNKGSETKPANTKDSNPTTQVVTSQTTPGATVTQSSKTASVQKTTQENNTNINTKESVAATADTQTAVVPTPNIQQRTPEKATPDVKNPLPVEEVIKTTKENPCNINAKIQSSPSCVNESTGTILIGGVTGGTAPYEVYLMELSASARRGGYSYLKSGTYTIRITDANQCVKLFSTEIAEKNCRKTSYVFAPEKGETWKISGTNNDDFTITILNMAGTQIYKSHVMQGEFEWQGVGQQGEYLSAGLYIYIIEYTNGQKENGQVTIVR